MLILGVVGAVLIVVAELSTIVRVDVLTTGTCEEIADLSIRDKCDLSGVERHGGAYFLLGALALAMAVGASRGASRPAALALIAIGILILGFTLARDLPTSGKVGAVRRAYENAEAKAGTGLYLEIVGAGLVLLAGVVRLKRPGVSPSQPGS